MRSHRPERLAIVVARRAAGGVPIDPAFVDSLRILTGSRPAVVGSGLGGPLLEAPQLWEGPERLTIHPISPGVLMRVLELIARADQELVLGLWLELPTQWRVLDKRLVTRARQSPTRLKVGPHGPLQVRQAAESLLGLQLTVLRGRTATQWAMIDAKRTQLRVGLAAARLGCTHQAVSNGLRRASFRTTEATLPAFLAILDLATVAGVSPTGATTRDDRTSQWQP